MSKEINHKEVILSKEEVKKRNEANKDISKSLNRQRMSHGPGGRVYLGQKATNRKQVLKRVWKYLDRYRAGVILVFIMTLITAGLAVIIPYLITNAINDYISVKDFEGAYTIALYIAGIAVLNSISRLIGRVVMVNVSQNTVKKIRKDAFDKLQLLPVSYYDKNQPGEIVSRITNDVDLISNSLSQVVNELFSSIITIVLSLVFMFIVNWLLAIVVLLFVPVMVLITMKVGKFTRKGFMAQQKHLASLNGIVEESISGIKVLKLYTQEKEIVKEFKTKNNELRDASFKAQVWAGIIMPVINSLNNLIYLVIIILGAMLMLLTNLAIQVGDIAGITMYARQFVQPISNLAQMFNVIQQGLAGAERVFNLIDEMDEYINDGEYEVKTLKGDVEFKNVTFGYDPDTIVLSDISFKAEEGKTVAIVGPTGSGKTTIINLLNRFYHINDGDILVDGKSIYNYKKDPLRQKIGVVLQDTNLFIGTVLDNIKFGNQTASMEEVTTAATLANAHDFIMKLPKGYESEVTEGGQNFSQGERQLISIARTILSNPDILILDEATSNVDTRTEYRIQKSMNTLMKGRTSFVIAHRLQTIRNAHKILVIKDGKLIETGDHKELLEQKGFYHDLYKAQFKDLVEE